MIKIFLTCLTATLLSLSTNAKGQEAHPSDEELQGLKSLALSTMPESSEVLAVCGPSEGFAYYLWPQNEGWQEDPLRGGRLVFVVSSDKKPNILFLDSRGEFINSRSDGGEVYFSFIDAVTGSFGLIETYPQTGVTQTYIVTLAPDGELYGLWTSAKSHISRADISKVSAHVTKCVN